MDLDLDQGIAPEPRQPKTAAATAAASRAAARRRNAKRLEGLLADAYVLTDQDRAFIAALNASAPPISDDRAAYLWQLLPAVQPAGRS